MRDPVIYSQSHQNKIFLRENKVAMSADFFRDKKSHSFPLFPFPFPFFFFFLLFLFSFFFFFFFFFFFRPLFLPPFLLLFLPLSLFLFFLFPFFLSPSFSPFPLRRGAPLGRGALGSAYCAYRLFRPSFTSKGRCIGYNK